VFLYESLCDKKVYIIIDHYSVLAISNNKCADPG